jgi:hypothetical protein
MTTSFNVFVCFKNGFCTASNHVTVTTPKNRSRFVTKGAQ